LAVRATAEVETVAQPPVAEQKSKGKIYIGHKKDDYAGRREGKPGRFIEDDVSKYPGKEDVGFMAGATGGWAGGEAGLQKFIEEAKKLEQPAAPAKVPETKSIAEVPTATGKKAPVVKKMAGDDLIYVGYGKDELDARKSGRPGAYIKDDARKYPGKESIGLFANVAGGFAGGEVGLKQYVKDGDISIAEDGKRRQGPSTLLIAGIVALAGTVGGLTLTQATNFSQELAIADSTGGALDVLDDNTKLLLQAAIVLTGITAGLAGTRAAFKAMTDSVTNNAINLAKVTAFWIVVFLAARFVLQS
jgi:hypothetical protein